jgi:hypothetical protein
MKLYFAYSVATVATTNVHCLYEDSKLRREEEKSEEVATYIVCHT